MIPHPPQGSSARTAEPKRLDHLTGLRGIAAYSVVLAHATDAAVSGSPLMTPALNSITSHVAYFGMSVFFTLSGFVIHYNYIELFKTRPFLAASRHFFAARFARLYPLYALAILLMVLHDPPGTFAGRPGAAAAYLTMTASWFNLEQLVYPPAWSISTEWFFYFVFALIAPFVCRLRGNPLWYLMTSVIAVPIIFMFMYSHRASVYPILDSLFVHYRSASAAPDYWFWYYSPYIRIAEFISGMLASAVWRRSDGRLLGVAAAQLLELIALGWCASVIFFGGSLGAQLLGPLPVNFGFAPALVIILLVSATRHSLLGRLLCSRALVFAGDISYSVYIFQWWAMVAMIGFFVAPLAGLYGYWTAILKVLAIAFVNTIMAYGSYQLFERPTRKRLRAALTSNYRHTPVAAFLIARGPA